MIVFERSGMKRVAGLDRSSSESGSACRTCFWKRLGDWSPSPSPECVRPRLHRGSTVPEREPAMQDGHPLGGSFPLDALLRKSYSAK